MVLALRCLVVLGLPEEYVLFARGGNRVAEITVSVDGVKYSDHVEPRLLLVHYLREIVGKTGTPIGCDTSNCGACTVLLNGESVKSCAVLAVQADGTEIITIEGMANGPLWVCYLLEQIENIKSKMRRHRSGQHWTACEEWSGLDVSS